MSNNYDRYRFISKAELARLANVSPRTFTRYLATKRQVLNAMGVSPKAQKLPPQAVRYICEDYCIDLPPCEKKSLFFGESPPKSVSGVLKCCNFVCRKGKTLLEGKMAAIPR